MAAPIPLLPPVTKAISFRPINNHLTSIWSLPVKKKGFFHVPSFILEAVSSVPCDLWGCGSEPDGSSPQDRTDRVLQARRLFSGKDISVVRSGFAPYDKKIAGRCIPPGFIDGKAGKKEETPWKRKQRRRRSGKSCPFV
jgi:hypothetical protein